MPSVCSVKNCNNTIRISRLHRLPKDDKLLRVWLEKMGRLELLAKPKIIIYDNHRICTAHFHPDEFVLNIRKQTVLRTGAIPSLLLPMNVGVQDAQEIKTNATRMDNQVPTTLKPIDVTERVTLSQEHLIKEGNEMCRKNMTESVSVTPISSEVKKEFVPCTDTKNVIEGKRTDCTTERPTLVKIEVPELYFPELYLASTSKDDNKMNNLTESLSNAPGTSGVKKELENIEGNRTDTPLRIINLSQLPERRSEIFKRKVMDQFLSFDTRTKRRKHSSPESIHNPTQKFTIPLPRLIPFKKSNIPKFKTVAVQTESIPKINEGKKEEDLQKVNFRRSIDLLRKTLVGSIQKFNGNTFRVNECMISLTEINQEIEKTETLLIRPNEVFSTCELFLDYLFKGDRVPEHKKNVEQIPPFSQKYYDSTVKMPDCDVNKNKSEDSEKSNMVSTQKKSENREDKTVPDFSREAQLLLHKLPEDLVEAAQNGHILQVVPTKNHEVKNGHPPGEKTAEIEPELLSVELSEYESKIEKDISKNSQSPAGIQNSIKVIHRDSIEKVFVIQENEFHQKKSKHKMNTRGKAECETCKEFYKNPHHNIVPKKKCPNIDHGKELCPECSDIFRNKEDLEKHLLVTHRTVLKKKEYACEACPQKFITYKSLMYHNKKTHNLDTIEDVFFKLNCEYCNEFLELFYYKQHLSECRKKYGEKQNQNIESVDTVKQNATDIGRVQTVMKQTSPLILDNSNIIRRERSKLNENTEESITSSSANRSTEILNKLEVLIGSKDGLNEITIVHLED